MKQTLKELEVKGKFKLSNIILKLLYISLTVIVKMAKNQRKKQASDNKTKQP